MKRLVGQGVSSGVASGEAIILSQRSLEVRFRLAEGEVANELERLQRAADRSREQLRVLRTKMIAEMDADHGGIFDAQILMLDDPMLLEPAQRLVRSERVNADWALQLTLRRISDLFLHVDDPYLRERSGDVGDVVGRLRLNLRDGQERVDDLFPSRPGPFVLVADELSPSLAAQIDWQRITGFAVAAGSWTYHTAILARSLGVPAIIGVRQATSEVEPGEWLVLDGDSGELIVGRTARASAAASPASAPRVIESATAGQPVATADGRSIRLEANIERPEDIAAVRTSGADGIGLYRSEYLLAGASLESVTEEVQVDAYRRVLRDMAPGRVTIRTFDVGESRGRGAPDEWQGSRERPGGLHAIRLSLANRDLFRRQLRALLRAACEGELRIMFPFVSGLDELRAAKVALAEARHELDHRGDAVGPVTVGAMIEVPSAALTADLLAREAEFFSIGTNDLVQHCVAADRADPAVSHLHEPFHPAVLRMIRMVGRLGRRHQVDVSVCGEMAAESTALGMLIGLGMTSFSMRPAAIPSARRIVQTVRFDDLRAAAREAMQGETADEIRARFSMRVTSLVSPVASAFGT